MAKRKHRTAYQKATADLEAEMHRQCAILYSATALALHRHWNKGTEAITRLLDITGEVWHACATDNTKSMIEMCYKETGIEVQNERGESWENIAYLNNSYPQMTNAQYVYMRMRQKSWIAPQIMACIMVALHRKYGFGFERLSRLYNQIDAIRTEYNLDPDKLREACREETHIDVHEVYTRPREGKEVV